MVSVEGFDSIIFYFWSCRSQTTHCCDGWVEFGFGDPQWGGSYQTCGDAGQLKVRLETTGESGWRAAKVPLQVSSGKCLNILIPETWCSSLSISVCSEKELTSCSLQVLSARGSPGRYLLALLADRQCPLAFLLQCLTAIEHREAANFLAACGIDISFFCN